MYKARTYEVGYWYAVELIADTIADEELLYGILKASPLPHATLANRAFFLSDTAREQFITWLALTTPLTV